MKKNFILLFSCLCILSSIAQNNNKQYFSHDVGILLGAGYYIGDLNSKQFAMSQPAVGIFYRFNYSYRVAFKAEFNYGNVQGDDSQSNNPDQLERNLNFKTTIMEFSVRSEFNFWEYRTGHKNFIFAPYIFLGIGVFHFDPQAHYGNQWISLRELSTEGQGTPLSATKKEYKLTQPCIPFGIGFKLTLSQQIGLGIEWGPRKIFTDYLDDVSGKYVDPALLAHYKGGMSSTLSNRSTVAGARADDVDKLRGNPSTKDWYFYYGLVISFKLKFKPKECARAF